MAEVLQRATYKPGDTIFKEGDEGSSAYVMQSGEVEVFKTIDGVDKVLGTIGQGAIFGEMALVDSQPRMASARARQGTTVIVVTKSLFDEKMAKTDPFIRGLLNILVEELRRVKH